jgi:hypothetical protein
MKVPAADSLPARCLSFPAERRTENASMRRWARSRPVDTGAWAMLMTYGVGRSNNRSKRPSTSAWSASSSARSSGSSAGRSGTWRRG